MKKEHRRRVGFPISEGEKSPPQPPVDVQLVDFKGIFRYNKDHTEVMAVTLGERIKDRREKLKLSQGYVAEQIGVSRQAVSKWETGQSEPTAENLVRLAEVFETSLAELVGAGKNGGEETGAQNSPAPQKPNLILRANLIKMAITAQVAFLFNSTSVMWQLRQPGLENEALYRGELAVSLVLLLCSSVWMASNHRWEADMARRRRNTRIELGYCCAQLCAAFLTVRFGLGLAGAVLMIAAACVYVLYINPRFMGRKLTK